MRLCAFDLETSGLDHDKDYITELGYVIKDWGNPKPLEIRTIFIHAPGREYLSQEIKDLTKIEDWMLEKHGIPLSLAIEQFVHDLRIFDVEAIVAHNGKGFDLPFLKKQAIRQGLSLMLPDIIDTKVDIPFPKHVKARSQVHIAAEMGWLNPFPHAACFDAMNCLKILDQFDIEEVWKRSRAKEIYLKAHVEYDRKELAKSLGYSWEKVNYKAFPKCWVKLVKEFEFESEKDKAAELEFSISRVEPSE